MRLEVCRSGSRILFTDVISSRSPVVGSAVVLCCAVLCCVAVLFNTRFLPHVLLVAVLRCFWHHALSVSWLYDFCVS